MAVFGEQGLRGRMAGDSFPSGEATARRTRVVVSRSGAAIWNAGSGAFEGRRGSRRKSGKCRGAGVDFLGHHLVHPGASDLQPREEEAAAAAERAYLPLLARYEISDRPACPQARTLKIRAHTPSSWPR